MKDNNLKQIAVILGIRPDIIRASQIIKLLKADKRINTVFIWSGQHYSDNLKDIFFREFEVPKPDVELDCKGESDAQITSQLISKLNEVFLQVHPEAAIFLGDTNTVIGCLAAAQLNIPIIHIEGCMRSYDWRMPEEKNRTIIDHLSDIIYTYLKEYKEQGIKEGLNPQNIMVVGNPIVDIINTFFLGKNHNSNIDAKQLAEKGLTKNSFYLMTCHRRENVHDEKSFSAIIELASQAPYPVYFPASYRTQKIIKEMKIELPKSIIQVDPIGYKEFMLLMTNSRGIMTDSGTEVEEACILNIPSIQMRQSTERPQVYDVGASVKFDPMNSKKYPAIKTFEKIEKLKNRIWKHPFGDGKASVRIAEDIIKRVINNQLNGHLPSKYHYSVSKSYREDSL